MAASKDTQVTRPQSQRRPSVSSSAMLGPPRYPTTRNNPHSAVLNTFNPDHRVNRRRSANSASISGTDASTVAFRSAIQQELDMRSRDNTQDGLQLPGVAPGSGAQEQNQIPFVNQQISQEFAIAEGFAHVGDASDFSTSCARRPSEGSDLTKSEGKITSGGLKCGTCGKGYKHSTSLSKHLWEHHPAWAQTSKMSMTKHQQVKMLQGASALVDMSQERAEPEVLRASDSNSSSVSPTASSGVRDDIFDEYSSAETSPPPMSERFTMPVEISRGRANRYSGMSSTYSRSYQSAPTGSFSASNGWSQYGVQSRPSTSGYAEPMTEGDESALAAAVNTSCHFSTPKTGPVLIPAKAPPVPPFPARYVEEHQRTKSGSLVAPLDFDLPLPSPPFQALSSERDVRRNGREYHYPPPISSSKSDDDDGVFGGMEGIAQEAHQELRKPLPQDG